jgi:polyvinyl alcohol dehydrogenase (cytochrome)
VLELWLFAAAASCSSADPHAPDALHAQPGTEPRARPAAASSASSDAGAAPAHAADPARAANTAPPTGGNPHAPGADPDDAGAASAANTPISREPAAHWTEYGFDERNTQANPNETILSSSSVPRLKEHWRLHMPDGASSTPAVRDGNAYFGGWDGRVYAVDAESGEIRWQRRVTEAQVNSTPLVTNDRVYVTAGASLVALSRADGATLYEVVLDTHQAAMLWSSPKLVDGMLIVGVASFENGITLTPTFTGSVVALEAESGNEIWRVPTTGMSSFGRCTGGPGVAVWSSAAIDEELGLAYIGTGQGYDQPVGNCADSLLAIEYRRGQVSERVRWVAQYSQGDVFGLVNLFTGPDADVGAAPNLFEVGGRKLVGAGDKGGSYRAFDRQTGELVWRTNFEMGLFVGFGGVVTTAALEGDTIYVASNHIQTNKFLAGGEPDPTDVSYVHALDTATGHERWRVELPAPIAGTFAIANGVLYHPLVDHRLYARDLTSGAELWSAQLQNAPGSGPSVVDGRVFISAGMSMSATSPTANGGFVACYTLDSVPVQQREAPPDVLEPMTNAQCLMAMSAKQTSAACSACLCACDATAAGHCGQCATIASCTVKNCGSSADKAARHDCMALFCNAKLLPSFVFDRANDLAPCMTKCAATCGY